MDNEKELTQQETAPKPKKPSKKKTTKQTVSNPEPKENTPSTQDAPEQTTSETWNFYNQLQAVETKKTHGGSNKTHPVKRNAQKRIRKAKTQRDSRRINRRK